MIKNFQTSESSGLRTAAILVAEVPQALSGPRHHLAGEPRSGEWRGVDNGGKTS